MGQVATKESQPHTQVFSAPPKFQLKSSGDERSLGPNYKSNHGHHLRNEDATFIFKGSSHSRTEMRCQNAPQTGAITGYLKVFGAKHIAKKKQKNGRLTKL